MLSTRAGAVVRDRALICPPLPGPSSPQSLAPNGLLTVCLKNGEKSIFCLLTPDFCLLSPAFPGRHSSPLTRHCFLAPSFSVYTHSYPGFQNANRAESVMNDEGLNAGDSTEQREAEKLLVAGLAKRLGMEFSKKQFALPGGEWLEIDGVCESPPILCEAWAHQGPPKSAQKNKVMTDAFKMLYAAKLVSNAPRMILAFGDERAAAHFRGRSWMAQALRATRIEVEVVELPEAMRAAILAAQKRQFR